jgi:hypothetical protein
MVIPEHVRAEFVKLNLLLEHHNSIVKQLEAQLHNLIFVTTGINPATEHATLDTQTWSVERDAPAG